MTGGKGNVLRRLRRALRRPQARKVAGLIASANAMRDAGRYHEAAALYEAALDLTPNRADIHVQAGHMFKEARAYTEAKRHYALAEQHLPDDADLQLQLGHFNKTTDRADQARAHYARAAALKPGWPEPERELAALDRREAELKAVKSPRHADVPIPELVPGPLIPAPLPPFDQIAFRRLGSSNRRTAAGMVPLLSGIEAIQGTCYSDRLLVEAQVLLDGEVIAREAIHTTTLDPPPTGSTQTRTGSATKAIFNIWIDLSTKPPGLYRLDLVLVDEAGWTRRRSERIAIDPPMPPGETAPFDSDGWIPPACGDLRPVEERVRALPSEIRPVSRMMMPPPATILVLRTDQLGDMVISIPALRRLRALFPLARIVGLVTIANVEFARTIGLFDDILVADYPDDPLRRRRTMTPEAQRELAARLATYEFDIAIDLATSDVSRALLPLAGARLTFGFDDGGSPWLDGGISGNVRDPRGRGNAASQSGRVLALVERLGSLCATGATVIPRQDLSRDRLMHLGLGCDERFLVLHAGARIVFSRWTKYPALARAWLDRQEGKVVLLTEGTDLVTTLPADMRQDSRLIVIDDRLTFDDLDALVSFASVFVGNDSGLKHLAALRGTPVVSVHSARISWAEWGQEQTGIIISRRVPCAGCALFYDADECGKDIACMTDISVDDVLTAIESVAGVRPA